MSLRSIASLIVTFICLSFTLLTEVMSSNICICQCCEGAHCTRNNTRAFTIYDNCQSGCTRDFCYESFPQYCTKDDDRIDIVATCVNRDTPVNPAVIVFFLLTVGTLVILGVAKNYVSYSHQSVKSIINQADRSTKTQSLDQSKMQSAVLTLNCYLIVMCRTQN